MSDHCKNPIHLVALDEGPDVAVGRPVLLLGRYPGCDVRLNSTRVSWCHCCLTTIDGAVQVRDLGSTNGIRINGRRVSTGWLKPGDELAIAHLRFRVEEGPVPRQVVACPAGLHVRE